MAFKFEEDESGQMSDINVVPLVDIMLVLLIIFMVTAPLSIGGIKVNNIDTYTKCYRTGCCWSHPGKIPVDPIIV